MFKLAEIQSKSAIRNYSVICAMYKKKGAQRNENI